MKIYNSLGLSVDFLGNGSLCSIDSSPIRISLTSTSAFSKSGANIYLRRRSDPLRFTPLLGPDSHSQYAHYENSFIAKGSWEGLDYSCQLRLSGKSNSWQWFIEVSNSSDESAEIDVIYVQDIGLKQQTDSLVNEYYVSQYIERAILTDDVYGKVICCRQNMRESTGNPWIMIACENAAIAACTDGMQFFGKSYRESGIPQALSEDTLGGEYSGELSVVAIQEKPFKLGTGENHKSVFVANYMPDHSLATSAQDLSRLPELMQEFAGFGFKGHEESWQTEAKNIFNQASFFPSEDLDADELSLYFGGERRHCEVENSKILSFFCKQNNHVVLRPKETLADRPHGHIMQAQAGYQPNESIVSTTSYAFGVFNSHLTQGNTNFNILLSVCASQFNLTPESGQRIFVEIDGRPYLLGVPSAFEIGLNHCRWIYKYEGRIFQVRSWTSKTAPRVNMDFSVLSGEKSNIIITHQFDPGSHWKLTSGSNSGEYTVKPGSKSMIAGKFPEAQFRIIVNSDSEFVASGMEGSNHNQENDPPGFFVVNVKETSSFCLSFIGEVCEEIKAEKIVNADEQWLSDCTNAQNDWQNLSLNLVLKGEHADIKAISEIIPWYGMNAITHFLTPHGLEQFGGAAWGTRDVAQGPFDLLLCMEKYDEAKQVLRTIFANQNPDGGWPQWWMFDSYSNVRADSAHGDIFYWCIIALTNYIKVTGDLKVLDELLPYYTEEDKAKVEITPLAEHLNRLVKMIVDSFIDGTALVPFGGGDWNDSLQPVSKELAQRMISSWTVEMNYQAFSQLLKVHELAGNTDKAEEISGILDRIKSDFNKYLVKDGIVAGYGLVEKDGSISVILHPKDDKTDIQYSILPMNRGILSDIFTPEQAGFHQGLIEQHLKGPDGARLMNRPLKYKGGIQSIFQRAESSTFFGREIGLMYIHEHIRYAESLAKTGRAEDFLKALRQANPVAYNEIVPCGDIRQSNCYYSSSDVAFKSRYEADECYDEIKTGTITLKGGWRVYSSGPGIYIGLIITRLLGIRIEYGNIVLDPVMPDVLDGISASIDFMGHTTTFKYRINQENFSPKTLTVNGTLLEFSYEHNNYRKGGAVIPLKHFITQLSREENLIEIHL